MQSGKTHDKGQGHSSQGNTFYQGCSSEHVGYQVAFHFRLTCHGLQCTAANLSNADTGTYSSKTCTHYCSCLGK